jgi:hypothetical protein
MRLRIKFCNYQRHGKAKLLKSLYPNAHLSVLGVCLLLSPLHQNLRDFLGEEKVLYLTPLLPCTHNA